MYPHQGREGEGAFVMHQVEGLRNLGHEVEVYHIRGYRSKLEYLKTAWKVWLRTCEKRFDVVHAHYGVAAIAAIFRWRVPLVITLHGSDALEGKIQPPISRCLCKVASATVVVSKEIARKIPGEIIPCGVDLGCFEPKDRLAARRRLGLDPKRRYVLFPYDPARPVKRFDLASGAIERLNAEGIDVDLLTVHMMPNAEMPWYYSACDAMVLCSDSEGAPTAVKEALACNIPVVTTDVGDVREIVERIEGVPICEQTVGGLAEGLRCVLNPPMGFVFNGREAMRSYSQERIVDSIVAVYRRVMLS
jgi:glycosyltransferase involved in cell wall biosynthesis